MEVEFGLVSGRVQGVGFRYFVQTAAEAAGVCGWARNLADGRVEVLLCGPDIQVERVKAKVAVGPVGARVDEVHWQASDEPVPADFTIG